MLEAVSDNHLGGQASCKSRDASTKRSQNDLLCRSRSLPGELHKLCSLRAAHPVWHHYLLELNIQPQTPQLGGDVVDGLLSLQGTAQSRTDVIAEMSQLPVRIVARKSSVL